jgi:hypothetical protein
MGDGCVLRQRGLAVRLRLWCVVLAVTVAAGGIVAGVAVTGHRHRSTAASSAAPSRIASASAGLSADLTGHDRQLAAKAALHILHMANIRQPSRQPSTWGWLWPSNVRRVVAAVGTRADAVHWRQPANTWQFASKEDRLGLLVVVQMTGDFELMSTGDVAQLPGAPPVSNRYVVHELTYVLSSATGNYVSATVGPSVPDLHPAAIIFER